MTDVRSDLSEMRELVGELSAVDREALQTLKRFEAILHKVSPGVPLSCGLSWEELFEFYEVVHYKKYSGKWRLVYESGENGGDPQDVTIKFLDEWSRDLCRRVVEVLPRFIKEATEQLKERVNTGRAHVARATAWLDNLQEELS